MTTPSLRLVAERDFAPIAALTNHYIATSSIHFGYEPVREDELRAAWREHRATHPWLVAEAATQLLGYAKAGPWRTRAAYGWTPEVGLYVQPDRHRQGIGRRLYGRLLDLLAAQGFVAAIGGITLPNPGSVALHEALGFRPAGVVRRAGWKHGAWLDVGFWQRDLQPDGFTPGAIRAPDECWPPG